MFKKIKKFFARSVIYETPNIVMTQFQDNIIIADNNTREIKQGRINHNTQQWEWQIIATF